MRKRRRGICSGASASGAPLELIEDAQGTAPRAVVAAERHTNKYKRSSGIAKYGKSSSDNGSDNGEKRKKNNKSKRRRSERNNSNGRRSGPLMSACAEGGVGFGSSP